MLNIRTKFQEVQTRKALMDGPEYYRRTNLKFREWDVLGCVCEFLERGGHTYPTFALEQEPPDFLTFDVDQIPLWPVEVTEVLEPDYRRGDFWRSDPFKEEPIHFEPEPLDDVWKQLRHSIASKSLKDYPAEIALMIYFDIPLGAFDDWDTPFEVQLLQEHSHSPFHGADQFSNVFVLSADMKRLVCIHPEPSTVIGS